MADIVAIYYNGQKSVIRDEWTRNVCRNVFQVERAQYNSSAMRSYAIAYRVPFVPQMIIDGDRIVTFFRRCIPIPSLGKADRSLRFENDREPFPPFFHPQGSNGHCGFYTSPGHVVSDHRMK